MALKLISIVIFFFEHYHLEIAKSRYTIQMDFDIQFDVPNNDHNVSSRMPHHKSHSSANQKLVSTNKIGPRNKLHNTKSRSLTGRFRLILETCCSDFLQIIFGND